MPFTFAHPAAAIPFRNTRLVFSAVVVGTMAPDFEYFLRMGPTGRFGHTIPGLFCLTLPLGLAVFWLFHRSAKFAMVRLLPSPVQRRLPRGWAEFDFGNARRFACILLSLLAGSVTHVLWDSFTHDQSWLVGHWPLLHEGIALSWLPGPHPPFVLVCKVLHFFSSLAGLGILTVCFSRWFHRTQPAQTVNMPLSHGSKVQVVCLMFGFALCGALLRSSQFPWPTRFETFETFSITLTALLWWQLVGLGWWWQSKQSAWSNLARA
jgi:membrane-bound metal-dependent hydrolase YbcI (DUF457 family)